MTHRTEGVQMLSKALCCAPSGLLLQWYCSAARDLDDERFTMAVPEVYTVCNEASPTTRLYTVWEDEEAEQCTLAVCVLS